jgi:hypothetical protein
MTKPAISKQRSIRENAGLIRGEKRAARSPTTRC